MKRTFLFQILTMLMFLSAYSHDIEVANADGVTIYYNYNDDGKELSVTRKANNYNSYSGKVVIPETITYNGQTYPVTSIGELAFRGCTGLTSVPAVMSVIFIPIPTAIPSRTTKSPGCACLRTVR